MTDRGVVFELILLVLVVSSGTAQQPRERDDINFARRCTDAAAIVALGRDVPAWANGIMGQCDVSGPSAVVARWRRAQDDGDELINLQSWSLRLRTVDVLNAALGAAMDQARTIELRLAALGTAVGYIDPTLRVVLAESPEDRYPARLTTLAHSVSPTLNTVTAQEAGQLVMPVVKSLASGGSHPRLASAALSLWGELANMVPAFAGIEPHMVAVEAVCRNRFRLTNRAPIPLSVTLVLDGDRQHAARLPADSSHELSLTAEKSLGIVFGGISLGNVNAVQNACSTARLRSEAERGQ